MRWQTGMAERLARGYGIASVAIDAVEHGDRLAGGPILDRDAAWAERQKRRNNPDEALYEHMIADWKATLDFVLGIGAPSAAIGYFGLSMGTRYGLPFLAMEPRIRVAVLGLNGIVPGEPTTPDHIMVKRLLAKAAARMSIPIHFIVQDGDELFPRENSLSLFDAIASSDKHLHLNPGGHGDVPVSEMEFAAAFLASHLKPVTTI